MTGFWFSRIVLNLFCIGSYPLGNVGVSGDPHGTIILVRVSLKRCTAGISPVGCG
jgi:hypothetical protein